MDDYNTIAAALMLSNPIGAADTELPEVEAFFEKPIAFCVAHCGGAVKMIDSHMYTPWAMILILPMALVRILPVGTGSTRLPVPPYDPVFL